MPTVAIVTTEFDHEACLQRESRGMADLEPAVVIHPISSLTLEQLDVRAAEAAPQAHRIWFGAGAARQNGSATAMFERAAK